MMPKISASPSAMRATTRPQTRPFSSWNSTRLVRSIGDARSVGEVPDDLRLPQVELSEVVVERGQNDVLQAGRGQLLDARANLRRRTDQVALSDVLPGTVGTHHALEARALLAVGDVLTIGRHNVREVQMPECQRLARAADLLQPSHDLL